MPPETAEPMSDSHVGTFDQSSPSMTEEQRRQSLQNSRVPTHPQSNLHLLGFQAHNQIVERKPLENQPAFPPFHHTSYLTTLNNDVLALARTSNARSSESRSRAHPEGGLPYSTFAVENNFPSVTLHKSKVVERKSDDCAGSTSSDEKSGLVRGDLKESRDSNSSLDMAKENPTSGEGMTDDRARSSSNDSVINSG